MVAPSLERGSSGAPKGNNPLFIPLPGDLDGVSGIVHVRKINAAEFGHPDAGRIQKFQHGSVPQIFWFRGRL